MQLDMDSKSISIYQITYVSEPYFNTIYHIFGRNLSNTSKQKATGC
jgi:hypothetical protein